MRNLLLLNELLSDYHDIDAFAYEIIKKQLAQGMVLTLPPSINDKLIKHKQGKQVPLILDLISYYLFKVATPAFSSLSHQSKIRKNCHKVLVFQDEILELDLILPKENKKMGIRSLNLDKISQSLETPNEIFVDRFFAEALTSSSEIKVWLKVANMSSTRKHFEDQEHIFNSQKLYDTISESTDWNRKLDLLVFEDKTNIIYERSKLWGYDDKYWKENMMGRDIMEFYRNKMQLYQLPIKDLVHLKEFVNNFESKKTNVEIMQLSPQSVIYETRVKALLKNIEENNYVET